MSYEEKKSQVLDVLDTFSEHTSATSTAELVNLFLQKTPSKMKLLYTAIDDSDFDAIAQLAHQLKSNCGFLGLIQLQTSLQKLEAQARRNDPSQFSELKTDIELHLKDYVTILQDLLESRKEQPSHEPNSCH